MISGDLMTFLHIVFKEISPSTQIYIHSHLDLNSVSSSTDMMKRLGPVPSSWRIPAPHVDLRRAAVSGGKHFPECETSGSQFAWVENHCHRHLRGVNILSRLPLLKRETQRILIHTVQPPLDHESTLAIVEARTLVILPLAGLQFELCLAACSITHTSKLAEPMMTWTQVLLLGGRPIDI